MHTGRECIFPWCNEFCKGRFGQSIGHYVAMTDAFGGEVSADIVHNGVKCGLSFIWDARHCIEHSWMSKTPLREAENHNWGSSHMVDDDLAACRNIRLCQVHLERIEASGMENAPNLLFLPLMAHVRAASEEGGKGILCDVVFGGAKASCRDYDGAPGEFFRKSGDNLLPIVRDGNHVQGFHPNATKPAGYH